MPKKKRNFKDTTIVEDESKGTEKRKKNQISIDRNKASTPHMEKISSRYSAKSLQSSEKDNVNFESKNKK